MTGLKSRQRLQNDPGYQIYWSFASQAYFNMGLIKSWDWKVSRRFFETEKVREGGFLTWHLVFCFMCENMWEVLSVVLRGITKDLHTRRTLARQGSHSETYVLFLKKRNSNKLVLQIIEFVCFWNKAQPWKISVLSQE